jgi:hypothetical protein
MRSALGLSPVEETPRAMTEVPPSAPRSREQLATEVPRIIPSSPSAAGIFRALRDLRLEHRSS